MRINHAFIDHIMFILMTSLP